MPHVDGRPTLADYSTPSRRRLRVFSVDPTYSRLQGETVVLSVPWERLQPGPRGSRIEVVDWTDEGPAPQVRLDDPRLLAQDGLAPEQGDPQFRQQMVYGVLASLLETLDRARGRRLLWRNVWRGRDDPVTRVPSVRPLRVVANQPGLANAHFTPGQGLTFGSYVATSDLAAGVFPGQRVYACLSHDIVNHEAAHAFLYELRPLSIEPLSPDALAFHEALGDILAILQHFQLPGLLEAAVNRSGLAIWERGPFVEMAGEFGRGAGLRPGPAARAGEGDGGGGRIDAVRRALDPIAEPTVLADGLTEPHQRGAVLVAAVFEAFFAAYTHGVTPLLRAAGQPTPSPGMPLPREQGLAPTLSADLLRLACDQARLAASVTTAMVVRAIDYLPPTAVRFGDFLDAVVLADTDLYPEDRNGFRRQFVEACRRRGIQPIATHPDAGAPHAPHCGEPMPTELALLAATVDLGDALRTGSRPARGRQPATAGQWHRAVLGWARTCFDELGLGAFGLTPEGMVVDGGNASFRVDQDGFPTAVVTVRLTERNLTGEAALPADLARLRLFGGVTLVAHPDGRLRHLLGRPVPGLGSQGQVLLDELRARATPIGATSLSCLPAPSGSSGTSAAGPGPIPRARREASPPGQP